MFSIFALLLSIFWFIFPSNVLNESNDTANDVGYTIDLNAFNIYSTIRCLLFPSTYIETAGNTHKKRLFKQKKVVNDRIKD